MSYQVIDYIYEKAGCEHCGTGIVHGFIIQDEFGTQMRVGSQCMQHFVTEDSSSSYAASKLDRRVKRAGNQWRSQKPPRIEGETRKQYINRRVKEMGNAISAAKAFQRKYKGSDFYFAADQVLKGWLGFDYIQESRKWQHRNIDGILNEDYGHKNEYPCPGCRRKDELSQTIQQLKQEARDTLYRQFEQEYQANRFDFLKPIWDLKKV